MSGSGLSPVESSWPGVLELMEEDGVNGGDADLECDEKPQNPLTRQSENSFSTSRTVKELDTPDLTDESDETQSCASDEAWSVGRRPCWKYDEDEDYDDHLCTLTNTLPLNDEKEDWDTELLQCAELPYDQDDLVELQREQHLVVISKYQCSEDMFVPSLCHAPHTLRSRPCNTAEDGQFSDADQ